MVISIGTRTAVVTVRAHRSFPVQPTTSLTVQRDCQKTPRSTHISNINSASHSAGMDWDELDLSPPYPSPTSLEHQLASKVLSIDQLKSVLNHSLERACLFADITLLSFLLNHVPAKTLIDLRIRDEDGLCIISQCIQGFSENGDADIDREECIRLLVTHGASVSEPDYCKLWVLRCIVYISNRDL